MITKKRREWSEAELKAVWHEVHEIIKGCDFRDAHIEFTQALSRLLLDARADLAEARADLAMYTKLAHEYRDELQEIRKVCFTDTMPEARARLEGAIEALTWVLATVEQRDLDWKPGAPVDECHERIAELRAELEKLSK